MTECEAHQILGCDDCAPEQGGSRSREPRFSGGARSFALVHARALRDGTYLHLNVEDDGWAIRAYPSPTGPDVVLRRGKEADLPSLGIVHSIPYRHSKSEGGEGVTQYRYWYDEIARANDGLRTTA